MSNPFRISESDIDDAIETLTASGVPEDKIQPWRDLREARALKDARVRDAIYQGNYREALMLTGSERRAAMLVDLEPRLTDDEVRDLLDTYWSITEAWSGDPVLREGMYRLLARVAPLHVLGEPKRPLRAGKTLTIYRGNLGETPGPYTSSWTTNRKTAEFFARMADSPRGMFLGMHREGGVPTIWRAKVARDAILGYFDDRGESEVVVPGTALKAVAKIAEAR